MSSHHSQLPANDPRQPSAARPYKAPEVAQQDLPIDYSGFIAVTCGVVGVMFRYKMASWMALIFCAQSLCNMRNLENDLKQVSMAMMFAIMGLVTNYMKPNQTMKKAWYIFPNLIDDTVISLPDSVPLQAKLVPIESCPLFFFVILKWMHCVYLYETKAEKCKFSLFCYEPVISVTVSLPRAFFSNLLLLLLIQETLAYSYLLITNKNMRCVLLLGTHQI